MGRLFFQRLFLRFTQEGLLIEPSDSRWADLWMDMEQIKVWKWKEEHTAPVLDGAGWSLELEHNSRKFSTYGHMAYPDPEYVGKTMELTSTQPFKKLIQSLNSLCGENYLPKW